MDEGGRVLKFAITPEKEHFTRSEYELIQKQLTEWNKQVAEIRVRVPSKGDTNPYHEKIAIEYQVQSQNTTHVELVFIIANESPLPENITSIEKFNITNYRIHGLDYLPNPNWDYNISRYFEILRDGVLICHATYSPNFYDDKVCNLEEEFSQGDTIVFTQEGSSYHAHIKKFITPNIVQLAEKVLIADFAVETDEGFGDEMPDKAWLDFNKIMAATLEPPYYVLDSRGGQINWFSEFD